MQKKRCQAKNISFSIFVLLAILFWFWTVFVYWKSIFCLKKKILNDQNNEGLKTHYILILKESLNNFQLMKNKYGNSWAIQREQDANKILKVSDKEEEIFINLMADFYNKNI